MGGHQQQHSRAGSSSKTAAPVGLQQRQQQPLSIPFHVESLLKTNTNSHTCQPLLRQGPHLKSPHLSFSLIFPFLLSRHHHQSTNESFIFSPPHNRIQQGQARAQFFLSPLSIYTVVKRIPSDLVQSCYNIVFSFTLELSSLKLKFSVKII